MPVPLISRYDPGATSEGSVDPLGLANLADRLADDILPGMTARMWRPGFLTAMAVSAQVVSRNNESPSERIASDGITPAFIVFEWIMVSALYSSREGGNEQESGIPGIRKAQSAHQSRDGLSAKNYLKTPTVFGFHGVYKKLGRALDVVDSDLGLGGNGYELLRAWEIDEGFESVADGPTGSRRTWLSSLQRAVDEGMKKALVARISNREFFVRHLSPGNPGREVRALLWRLLVSGDEGCRRELLKLWERGDVRRNFQTYGSGSRFFRWLSKHERTSGNLRHRLQAIDAYEDVCRILMTAFALLRYYSSKDRSRPIKASDSRHELRMLLPSLDRSIALARRRLLGTGREGEAEGLWRYFGSIDSGARLFDALLERHENVQKQKPPSGKRPWFERAVGGGAIVRPPYRQDVKLEVQDSYIHSYRLANVASFVRDLRE